MLVNALCRATGSLVRDILPRYIGDRRRSVVAVSAAAAILPQTWISSQQQRQTAAFSSARSKPPSEDKPFVVKSDVNFVKWTSDEDQRLREGVKKYGRGSWTKISEALLPYRSPDACRHRWTEVLDPKIKNGTWTAAEDARLTNLVGEFGEKWTKIAAYMDGRTRSACNIRWTRCIDPSLNHGPWSASEDAVLLKQYALHPNNWVIIKERLPGRSDMSIRFRHKKLTKPDPDYIRWTDAENQLLSTAVCKHGSREWSKVAEDVPGRSREQCKDRWNMAMTHYGKTMIAWSEEDDALLKKRVEELGTDKWAAIAEGIPGKTGQECKSRWERVVARIHNTDPWSAEEDATIKKMRGEGKPWNEIFSQLPGRGESAILKRCEELGCAIAIRGKFWAKDEIEALRIALLQYKGKKLNKKDWEKIAEQVPSRTWQQCKTRLSNSLRPKVQRRK